MAEISTWFGFAGVIIVLIAFYFSQANKIDPYSYNYGIANLIGAILLLFSLYFHVNWPSIIIEIAWMSISIHGILLVARRRSKR